MLGDRDGSTLHEFSDFNSSLYPDSIAGIDKVTYVESIDFDALSSVSVLCLGMRVEGRYKGLARWYPGVIEAVYDSSLGPGGAIFDIEYDDGDKELAVRQDLIRPLVSVIN